jgi:para-nitrobenzyl esterase
VDRLLAAQAAVGAARRIGEPLPFSPVVDGGVLPVTPQRDVMAGGAARIEVIVGTNREEMTLFAIGDRHAFVLDDAGLRRRLGRVLGAAAGDAIEAYAKARTMRGEATTPSALWFAILTDLVFRVPVLRFAEAQAAHQPSTFTYLFTWPSPVLGGILGAPHALEIPFVFGTHDLPGFAAFTGADTDPRAARLSRTMMDAWIAFAHHGLPGPDWPAYDAARRTTMVFDVPGGAVDAPMDDERRFWDDLG